MAVIVDSILEEMLDRSWQVRRSFFPDWIEFAIPNRTMAVTVTGNECQLCCAHCGGRYLERMTPLKAALKSDPGKVKSYLISGGCDRQGRVPLLEHQSELKDLASRGSLNLHAGLVGREEAKSLGKLASVVSFDLIGDDETIDGVYGLPFKVKDYLRSYRYLQRYTRVVPHICIGLNAGQIKGEYEALRFLQSEAVEAISLIIFRPTAGTAFSAASPPPPEEVARLMVTARLMFPRVPLYLGCMRPGGCYRETVDLMAIRAGFNKIVLPAPAARLKAAELGLAITFSEECCSL
jgi:lipoyl synthase